MQQELAYFDLKFEFSHCYYLFLFSYAWLMFQFSKVREAQSFLSLPCIQIEILSQTRQEMNMVPSDSLSRLVMDWIRRVFAQNGDGKFTYDTFTDKVNSFGLAFLSAQCR